MLSVLAIALTLAGVAYATSFVALTIFGWHPMPDTVLGCALHVRFHSWTARREEPHQIIAGADCLKITIDGRTGRMRDRPRIAALGTWFAARSDGWQEAPILFGGPTQLTVEVQPCGRDQRILANQDWIGVSVGKGFWRPICRDEWRQLIALAAIDRS